MLTASPRRSRTAALRLCQPAAGDHKPVVEAILTVLPSEDLLFLTDLGIQPVLARLGL